jgi:hypothetical protein
VPECDSSPALTMTRTIATAASAQAGPVALSGNDGGRPGRIRFCVEVCPSLGHDSTQNILRPVCLAERD